MRSANHKVDLEKETQLHEGGVPLLRGLMDQGQLDAVQMFNSLTPDMVASGKYRILATIRGLIKELEHARHAVPAVLGRQHVCGRPSGADEGLSRRLSGSDRNISARTTPCGSSAATS